MIRRQRVAYFGLLILAWISLVGFLGWWVLPGHVPHNFHGRAHAVDVALFVLLTLVLAHRMFMDAFSWIAAWGVRRLDSASTPPSGLRVAFITTFVPASEPLDMLARTLPAMQSADYPHDTWVLDEGDDPDVKELCAALGVHYFTRRTEPDYNQIAGRYAVKTKGGNHNAWYDAAGRDYDVVAQIDTDFIPNHEFLTRTLGYFSDPDVGFVGTPQVYGNLGQSFVARGAAQQLFMFYGAIMRGLAGRGSANMIGANHVVRVAALRDIGFYAGHLTEDLLTGMLLHGKGWKSRYVPQPLAVGEGPATWQAYFNQQMRWAFGCIDILMHKSMQLTRTMGRRQRLLYLALQQHYFCGIAGALGIVLLCLYFFGGLVPADVSIVTTLLVVAPLVITRQLVSFWLQRFAPSPDTDRGVHWAGRYLSVVTWPIYLLAAIGVVRQRRLVFKVTPKGALQRPGADPISVAYPHLALGLVSVACLVGGLVLHHTALAMLFWAGLNGALMLSFVAVVAGKQVRAGLRSRRYGAAPEVSRHLQSVPATSEAAA